MNVPIYTSGAVPLAAVPTESYITVADVPFIDAIVDGQSFGGIDITGLIQSFVVPAGGGATSMAYILDFNATMTILPNVPPVNTSVTGGYNIACAAVSEVAIGAQEWFTFHFVMPISRTGRGPRKFTITTTHQDTTVSNMTGVWNDSTTPLNTIRLTYIYNTLVAAGGNGILKSVTGGGTSNIVCKALGFN